MIHCLVGVSSTYDADSLIIKYIIAIAETAPLLLGQCG